ncbi:MAG: septum formation initiator family protein [Fimbriimonadales bacterium]|nr:septum formation initiator family protein [Fimbriimonadales bacterium]
MAKTGRFTWSWSLGLWLVVLLLAMSITPRTVLRYTQWRQMRLETAQLQQELLALRAQERALQDELKRVQTDPGRESLARQRGWIRKGEEPLRINP